MTQHSICLHRFEVRALLDGRLGQLRRPVKLPFESSLGVWEASTVGGAGVCLKDGTPVPEEPCLWHTRRGTVLCCPFGAPGDVLLGKEALTRSGGYIQYRVDGATSRAIWPADWVRNPRPATQMPAWAVRHRLPLVGVRVERLQMSTEADIKAMGFTSREECAMSMTPGEWNANRWQWVLDVRSKA